MKILRKKLKKVSGIKKFFYYFSLLLYLTTYIGFVYSLLKLKRVETIIRTLILLFFGIWLLIYLLEGLLTMISRKNKTFIFITLITILFCPVFGGTSYIINYGYNTLSNVNNNQVLYTTNLITLKETNFNNSLTIGMIEAEDDIEGNILAKKLISNKNLTNNIKNYEDYHSMITDLYNGKIGACFVSSNYSIIFENETFEDITNNENPKPISEKVKVIYDYSEKRDNQDVVTLNNSKNKTLTEPFTVLIMGVDSTIDGLNANQAFNGDTLIMVTFNPNTLTATMFSIPRDMYVPIACNHNRYAKINSSAAYGSSCVINTIQQLTGIDIDYYLKMNFIGVVDLVEALGGVTVDVETPDFRFNAGYDCNGKVCEQNSLRQFGKNMIYIDPGLQTLDGEQALAYARCRHLYASSDIARNQHQQQIIEAMAKKLKEINSLTGFKKILDTISKNIETNMTPEQIISFYSVGKDMLANSSSNSISIKKTYLSYYNLNVYLPNSGMTTSALGYYQQSLDAITKLMRVNLELEDETPIKTFSISYNEEYTTPVVGKGLTGGSKLQLVESFIGQTEYDARTWCNINSKTCLFENVTDYRMAGTIVNQSAFVGELLNSISSITFYVSDGRGNNYEQPGGNDNDNKDDDDNNSPIIPGLPNDPDDNETETPDNDSTTNDDKDEDEAVIPGLPEIQ